MHTPLALSDQDRALATCAHMLQRAAGTLQAHAADPHAVPTHEITLAHVEEGLDRLAVAMEQMANAVADWCGEPSAIVDENALPPEARALRWHLQSVADKLRDSELACASAATGHDGCSATHRQIDDPPGSADGGWRMTICIGVAIGANRHERDARSMHQPVIAAVDPLRDDIAPVALGLMLARLTSAPLLLAGAYPVDPHVDGVYPELNRAFGADAEQGMSRFGTLVEHAPGPRVRVATTVVASAGSPARALHDLAERQDASLLVLGSSRRGLAGRVLPGAVTDRLLHGAPCPVAVAPGGFSFDDADGGPRLIGAAFTDTPDGRAALARACVLAARARGLVRVLTVSEPLDPLITGALEAAALEYVRSARDDTAETVLRRGLDAVSVGRSAGGEILTGLPAGALAAASHDLDLLVCGSRGYGPVRTLLLGGTSHALVRKAACPVLVVPPGSPAHNTTTTVPRPDEHALAG